MIRPERRLVDFQRPFQRRARRLQVLIPAEIAEHVREVGEADGHIRMIRPVRRFDYLLRSRKFISCAAIVGMGVLEDGGGAVQGSGRHVCLLPNPFTLRPGRVGVRL